MGCNLPYTKEQREWARIYFSTHSLKETTNAFNEKYKLNKKETAIRHLVAGIKNTFYTIEMLDFLKEMATIPNNTWKYITQEFNKKFNTNKSCKALHRFGYLHGISVLRDQNYTIFPKPKYEIGTEIIRDKYIVVKVAAKHKDEKANWKLKHYMIWEQYNGKVMTGSQVRTAAIQLLNRDAGITVKIAAAKRADVTTANFEQTSGNASTDYTDLVNKALKGKDSVKFTGNVTRNTTTGVVTIEFN